MCSDTECNNLIRAKTYDCGIVLIHVMISINRIFLQICLPDFTNGKEELDITLYRMRGGIEHPYYTFIMGSAGFECSKYYLIGFDSEV